MRRSLLQSKTCAITFILLIVVSSLSAVRPTHQVAGGESSRGEVVEVEPTRGEGDIWYVDDDAPDGGDGSLERLQNKIMDGVR